MVSAYTKDQAQVQLDLLESAFSAYSTEHEKIMEDLSDDQVNNFIVILEDISNVYMTTKSLLATHIKSRKPLETASSSHELTA